MADDCDFMLSDEQFLKSLHSIDAMMTDIFWPCGLVIGEILKRNKPSTTMIAITPMVPWSGFLRASGSSFNYAFQGELTTGLPNKMTFSQRLLNILYSTFAIALAEYFHTSYSETAIKLGLPSVHFVRSFSDFDLHLTNIDFASEFTYPLAPNVKPVGGLTVTVPGPLEKVGSLRLD